MAANIYCTPGQKKHPAKLPAAALPPIAGAATADLSSRIQAYEPHVIRIARKFGRNLLPQERDELRAACREGVWRAIRSHTPGLNRAAPLEAFVVLCVQNAARDFLRTTSTQQKRRGRTLPLMTGEGRHWTAAVASCPSAGIDPADTCNQAERIATHIDHNAEGWLSASQLLTYRRIREGRRVRPADRRDLVERLLRIHEVMTST